MSIRILFQVIWLCLISGSSLAAIDNFEFPQKDQQERYQTFIDEMRCPKCDNQSLSGSNSAIAADLRKQLYEMVISNKTDDEIVTYMVDRYGDFILYKPRFTYQTFLLWAAPISFFLVGLLVLVLVLRSRKSMVNGQGLSSSERAELKQLLDQYSDVKNKNGEAS